MVSALQVVKMARSDPSSACYTAPEIYVGNNYSPSVDLWSLGVIMLECARGLPAAPSERGGQHRNERKRIKEWANSWCQRIVDQASYWLSFIPDGLPNLLTMGMLRMEAEERFSAGECLKRGYHLGLFDRDPFDTVNATPTQQTVLQGGIGDDDDGSSTIILGVLWATEENSNYDYGGTGCSGPEYASTLEPPATQSPCPGLASFGPAVEPWTDNIQAPVDLRSGLLEARWTYPMIYKRQRSSGRRSAKQPSSKNRIKRRLLDVRSQGRSISRTYAFSDRRLRYDDGSIQFRTMYDAVLALLMDLQLGDNASQATDDHTPVLVADLCEYFTRLEITGMRLTQNDHTDGATVKAVSNSREFVLASLTSSELMSSTADLAAHLVHMLQLQSPRLRNTTLDPAGDSHFQADYTAQDDYHPSRANDDVDSQTTMASAQQYGLTYPSALLDDINNSGCAIPTLAYS